MTAIAPGRALPIRVPITDGESLDSWLEALARRNGMSIPRLLPALGWRPPASAARLSLGVPGDILRRTEQQTGLAAGRLDQALLDRYLTAGPVRRNGSRFCPQCLTERDGRWMLTWRLPWIFACTTHGVLLHGNCPACGQLPRGNLSWAGLNPPASCPAPARPGTRCEADLTGLQRHEASTQALQAQSQIASLLAEGRAAAQTFTDLTIIAGWLLHQAPAERIAGFGQQALASWQSWRIQPAAVRRVPPASAALTAAAAILAMPLIAPADDEAIRQIQHRLPAGRDPRTVRPPGLPASQWTRLSPASQNRFLRALDPGLTPLDRLRYRSGTVLARLPDASPSQLTARARQVPQLLWPGWAIRLMPAGGFLPVPFRSAIATCLLLPGNPARAVPPAGGGAHAYRSSFAIKAILRSLAGNGHDSVLAAISCLASYLDAHGSPIDYQHRRQIIPGQAISNQQWLELCDQAGAHPGEERRHTDAGRYIYQLLTGADLNDLRCPLTFRSRGDRANYAAFTDTLTTPLRAALHGHAAGLLDDLGIAEPLTWEPPTDCCAGLALPGRDPGDIDLDALTQLMITQQLPPGAAARHLGTTISHVRLALEHVHRPAPHWGARSLPTVRQWQQRAHRILTREFFQREYAQAGKTLRQIETETGFPRKYLAERARHHGFPVTSAFEPLPIDPGWLHEQYILRQRSYTDIAAELGVRDVTVIAAARRHGISSRAPGVHSRPEMITSLGGHIPPNIRRAVEGSLHGWQRLHRFQAAMNFPSIKAAATHLGVHQAALIHQFHRLERDIGDTLYQRAAPGKPMRPTKRGAALLAALNDPEVAALMGSRPGATTPSLMQPGPAMAPRHADVPARDHQSTRKRTNP